MNQCENCGIELGLLEPVATWEGHKVCTDCHALLNITDFSHIADEVFRDLPLRDSELISEQKRRIADITRQTLRIPCPLCKISLPKSAETCDACGWRKYGRHGFDLLSTWPSPPG
jgi:hypothetical protein